MHPGKGHQQNKKTHYRPIFLVIIKVNRQYGEGAGHMTGRK